MEMGGNDTQWGPGRDWDVREIISQELNKGKACESEFGKRESGSRGSLMWLGCLNNRHSEESLKGPSSEIVNGR